MCITQYISICGYREHKGGTHYPTQSTCCYFTTSYSCILNKCHIFLTSQYPQIYFFPQRDFMDPTMDNTKHILNYLMPIIERVNPEVHDFMQQ